MAYDDDEDDESDETIPCPHCMKEIYDDTEKCPCCGQYISREDAPREGKPLWILIAAVLCLGSAILWIWR